MIGIGIKLISLTQNLSKLESTTSNTLAQGSGAEHQSKSMEEQAFLPTRAESEMTKRSKSKQNFAQRAALSRVALNELLLL